MKLSDIYSIELIFLPVGIILGVNNAYDVIGISAFYLLLKAILMYARYPLCRIHARKTLLVSSVGLEMILFFTGHVIWILIYTGLVLILISKAIGLFQPYTLQMLLRNGILFAVSVCVAGVTYRFLVKSFSSRLQFYEK